MIVFQRKYVMRGYFGIGVEQISKSFNVGNLFRSAHAFNASFMFTINAQYNQKEARISDTSDSGSHIPLYNFPALNDFILPDKCSLVGVELLNESIDLPSFSHPTCAAYVLGPERGTLSDNLVKRCDYLIKIPSQFCFNLGIAGAIVMYDRIKSLGKFAPRPNRPGGSNQSPPTHIFGDPKFRQRLKKFKE